MILKTLIFQPDSLTLLCTVCVNDNNGVKINYRPVNLSTLTNDVQTFPPKERVY